MLAYAADRPRIAARQNSPKAMLLIIGVHVIIIAIILTTRMGISGRVFDPPTSIISVPLQKPPPPAPAQHMPRHTPPSTVAVQQNQELPPLPSPVQSTPSYPLPEPAPVAAAVGNGSIPELPLPSRPVAVSSAAQLLTPPSELKPPYPESKLLAGEEALLTLRLAIDEHGRVVAVDPIGRADAAFLAAARTYLLAHWRYKPAMQNGQAVASSIVVTLRFQLDG